MTPTDENLRTRLEAEVARMREALEPFAEVGEAMSWLDTSPWVKAADDTPYASQGLTFGDFRRARAVLQPDNLTKSPAP